MKSPDETNRPECFDRVVAHVRRMIEESGDPIGFDVIVWTAAWIERPLPALEDSPRATRCSPRRGASSC